MSLRDVFIITEGLQDQENRELAERATRALIDNIGRIKKPHYVGIDDDDYVSAIYRGWEMKVDPELWFMFEKTIFYICAVPKGQKAGYAAFSHRSQYEFDTLSVYFAPPGDQVTEEAWGKYVEYKNAALLEPKFNPIVHEFIHCQDSKKLSDPKYMDKLSYDPDKVIAGDKAERVKYANEPLEFNGIFQQFAQDVEQNVKGAGGLAGLKIKSAHDMVAYGRQTFPQEWIRNLSPELQRHFVKRLTQLYYDMKSKYS